MSKKFYFDKGRNHINKSHFKFPVAMHLFFLDERALNVAGKPLSNSSHFLNLVYTSTLYKITSLGTL